MKLQEFERNILSCFRKVYAKIEEILNCIIPNFVTVGHVKLVPQWMNLPSFAPLAALVVARKNGPESLTRLNYS